MRIGFFTDTYAQINGVTTIIKMLEKQLRDLGHEVHIFAPRSTHKKDKENPFLHTSEAVKFLPSPEYKLSPFPIFLFDLPPLDIIHIHSPIS
ncbi:MAG: glycosyltransferase, partial [Candidatus Helarchaeota archaeon]